MSKKLYVLNSVILIMLCLLKTFCKNFHRYDPGPKLLLAVVIPFGLAYLITCAVISLIYNLVFLIKTRNKHILILIFESIISILVGII